jgi:hypothetical protein
MTREIDIAERQALAQPRDFPEDMDRETTWNVCGDCLRCFQGIPTRIQCRVCEQRKTI